MTATEDATQKAAAPLGTPAHPLEPLTTDEVSATATIIKAAPQWTEHCRFVYVELQEPAKDVVTGWQRGQTWDRQASALVRDRDNRTTCEIIVSLGSSEVMRWEVIDGVQPPMMAEEFMACNEAVRSDAQWQEALRKRGVEDFALAMIDPWSGGYTGPDDHPAKRRIARPLTFIRTSDDDNGYARPVEGLIVTVDLDEMKVVDVTDHGVVPLPPKSGNYYPELVFVDGNVPAFTAERAPLAPLEITQPGGPTFTVEGHHVTWSNWQLRIGFTPREGLVIYDVGYNDKGTLRPVLHRGSLSEMYIPYGDPNPTHWNKNVFDEGEYGLGWLANSLELGCDCLGEIRYFDTVANDQDGNPLVMPNTICMHEEDYSIGWKHTDSRTGRAQVQRNRRLVISFIATVGNYEYGFYWHFYLDGSIEFEIKLTGILSTGAIEQGSTPEFGTLVAPGLYGPNHEHYFGVRLDMRVDGDKNNLFEVNSVAEPVGPTNPHNNAWRAVKRQLASESEAQRLPDSMAARTWLISSSDKLSALGEPTGYKLEPGPYTRPLWQDGSQQSARGGFATKQLWGTAYDVTQRYAAGDYVAQNPGGDGLPAYAAGNRSLVDCDLVLWQTMSANHIVRPEDWPVMPVSSVSMHLKPFGFFDGNPMLDLPAPKSSHCSADECTCGH